MNRLISSLLPLFVGTMLFLHIPDATAQSNRNVTFSCVNFPPFQIEKPKDGLPGFSIEFLRAAFAKSETNIEFKYYPWKRALKNVMKGSVDGLCGCSYRPEREEKLLYSDPLGELSSVVFYNKTSKPAQSESLESLSGRAVGVVRGYNLQKELISHNIKPYLVNDEKMGINMLIRNRIDFFYSFKAPGQFALAKNPGKNVIRYFVLKTSLNFACISKSIPKSSEIVDKLNKGLAAIKADGTYDRILDKYR